ncbi:acetyl/propionyl-CoA carboxylase subunit alpha [Gordonia sp. PP30]|uniref:acetyl/propionyl/methylcrotonyl-CoA carboxylase subunit alpha n=1 Tax=Gordonia sp. PP30 TaxID=2935861 RepID=UPI0020000C0F|nr:biotin carboxylase N-terminal domain-containing protein [Gordonia sp. PP30]UQE74503.1 acetyl/propionyl-CoA carboxylase subunit alpha [Gordonia sp. PP30]
MITSVLVANRGEIARRVFATCRAMGLGTVAVYSDPDADAPHVRAADAAVRLPGSTSAETYLRGDLVIAAARSAGADAIHPGYGFLSENAEFAQAVIDAGLTWIGPPPAAITAMGSKVNAKEAMKAAGVPVLSDLDPASVTEADLPLLIKASAGGGGRGMRIVRELGELDDAVAAAAREAQSAFGDPTVFCEPYIERGHHIEVQIMADAHGTVWAVGERECSIQRRHQKVIEEAPAPLVERLTPPGPIPEPSRSEATRRVEGMRDALYDAARTAASSIGYVGAGTVEFLADATGRFFFLETNTRLQVEHPVTELTTGVDLVAWQLRVAQGEPLDGDEPRSTGHSIEVRLYAEDPANDWQPQSGTVHTIDIPADVRFALLDRPGIRVDSGIADGSEISTYYDPMLAKVISWAPTRRRAAAMLARALADARIHGLVTNRDLLVNILREERYLSGDTDTAYLDSVGLERLSAPLADDRATVVAAVAAALAQSAADRAGATVLGGLPSGWRNLPSGYQSRTFAAQRRIDTPPSPAAQGADDDPQAASALRPRADAASGTHTQDPPTSDIEIRYRIVRGAVELPDLDDVEAVSWTPDEVVLRTGGVARRFSVAVAGDEVFVDWPGASASFRRLPRYVDPSTAARPGSLLAPMPGSVIRVAVAEGDRVTAGQPLLWLEAMKMEHTISAPSDGIVSVLAVTEGRQLSVGDVLAVISDESELANAAE